MNTISASINSRTIQQSSPVDEAEARRKANYEAFSNMLEDLVRRANAQAHEEYLSQQTGTVSTQVKLTEQQKQHLSAAYNAQNMSEAEFAAFVEDLYQFGILTDRDKSILGYGEKDSLLMWRTIDSVAPYVPGQSFDTLGEYSGNALAWTKYKASIQNFDPQARKFYYGSESLLFARLNNILKQINGSVHSPLAARVKASTKQTALSAAELAELSKKYSPDHMTQEEYDAFLDELEEKCVLSKDDKMLVKNPEMRFGDVLEPHGISAGGGYIETDPLVQPKSLLDYDGNVYLYVKAMLAYELALAEKMGTVKEDQQRMDALRRVTDVLEGMRK